MPKPTWTTQDGTKIPVKEMSDSHIKNTLAYCRRAEPALRNEVLCNLPDFSGDMAQFYAEREWDYLMGCGIDEFLSRMIDDYEYVLEEAARRGLEKDRGEVVNGG